MGKRPAHIAAWTAWIALACPGFARAQHVRSPAPAVVPAPPGATPAAPPPPPPPQTAATLPDAPASDEPRTASNLGPESAQLAELRDVECDGVQAPASLAEEAAREGVALPDGLDAATAARIQLPELSVRVTPRLLRALATLRGPHRGHRGLVSWLRRAGRYRTRIETILQNENVPRDLLWVVAAESAFNPTDLSGAGASGLWQLMPEAARTYGLRIDAWLDERRDADRATRAAARMLRDLRQRFGTWELALAAYNMGYNALLRSIRKYNTNDFEIIAAQEAGLPFETAQYVPRILAGAIAANNPDLFDVADVVPDGAVLWDDLEITRSLPLDALAHSAGADLEALRALNPALLALRTPPADSAHPFVLHVPPGTRARFDAAATALTPPPARLYRLRHGESIEEIAARFQMDPAALLALSGFGPDARPDAGTDIFVPDREPLPRSASAAGTPAERPLVPIADNSSGPTPPNRHRVFYRTGPGDEIATVARSLGVSRDELLAWNTLDARARLQSGLWLQAYIGSQPVSARVWDASEVQLVQRGSEDFHDRAVAENGRVRVRVIVRDGDTMASVAARYGVTTGTLARINSRGRHAPLTPGEELVVYVRADDLPSSDPTNDGAAEREPATDGEESAPVALANATHATASTVRPGARAHATP